MLRFLQRHLPLTPRLHGHRFLVVDSGRRLATPLLLALIVIELTYVLLAVDSIPAVFEAAQGWSGAAARRLAVAEGSGGRRPSGQGARGRRSPPLARRGDPRPHREDHGLFHGARRGMAPRGLGRQGDGGLPPAPWRVVPRRGPGRGTAARDLVIDGGHRLLEGGEALDQLAI